MNQQISLDQTTPVKCDNCGSEVFNSTMMMRKVSKLLIGQLEDQILQIPTYNCASCGELLQDTLPEQLKTTKFEEIDDTPVVPFHSKSIFLP